MTTVLLGCIVYQGNEWVGQCAGEHEAVVCRCPI